ncbi:MAG TPA: hypothetical protein VEX36_05755 [Thermoleophilaceae bacterium]|nr:hypothetical protein [Thermoleophilaceae bacterium]
MMRAKARFGLLALLILGAIGAFAPAQASAFVSYYDCVLKPSNQWCDGRANGSYDGLNSWDYNQGWYPGASGVVTACQRIWRPSTGGVLGSSCGADFTFGYYGNVTCICYEAEVKQISGGNHSINGYADSAY